MRASVFESLVRREGPASLRGFPRFRVCLLVSLTILLSLAGRKAGSQNIPANLRSINIVAKVQPRLMEALRSIGARYGASVFIRIFKKEGELEVWVEGDGGFRLFKIYYICDYSEELGPKEHSGDTKSPEGFYSVTPGSMNPYSLFHLSFDIGYPSAYDLALGRTGDNVMVHGSCYSKGCFAMTDDKIEEIYALLYGAFRHGQARVPVHIFPFRMTRRNMARYRESKWYPFWSNLKEGYDIFEKEKRPPEVSLRDGRYAFSPSREEIEK